MEDFLNWHTIEQAFYDKAKEVIDEFAEEHPGMLCSFFAITADPLSGEFAFSFDTPQNAVHEAMKEELRALGDRQLNAAKRSEAWRYAGSLSASLLEYPVSTELFHYFSYATLNCDWLDFADSQAYPERQEGQEDYLEGHTRLVIWHVIERLVAERIFLHLSVISFSCWLPVLRRTSHCAPFLKLA